MIPVVDLNSYRYTLPKERIAHYPVTPRDQSKLLVCDGDGAIVEKKFNQLLEHLPTDALLVFNQTKVVRARLLFQTATGAHIELFCLEPLDGIDQLEALSTKGSVQWKCLVGNAKRWKDQALTLTIAGEQAIVLTASLQEKQEDCFIVLFSWSPSEYSWVDVLEATGKMPLPPYIKREASQEDEERYQTVYAKTQGSVAAPTAGLHFTDHLLASLQAHGVKLLHTTLHVGAGTFKPIKAEHLSAHEMHAEELIIELSLIEQLCASQQRSLVAVGTTSVRCIESLYWMGVKISQGVNTVGELNVSQWDPYNLSTSMTFHEALIILKEWMITNNFQKINVKTSIMIVPGYRFKGVDLLITNFHQPDSSLMLLIAAFLGNRWEKVYEFALKNDFRFLSYGDSSLLTKNCG